MKEKYNIRTSKGEFVVVELLEYPHTIYHTLYGEKLDLICKLPEATEDDAKLVVDEPLFGNYKSYISCFKQKICSGDYVLKEAIESLHSLLKSKGIDVDNGNWYLFKKI